MDLINEWWKQILAAGFLIVGAAAITWLKATFVSKKVHDKFKEATEGRLNAMEQSIQELPSKEDLHELDKSLIEVGGKIDALSPQLADLKRVTDLLMENELRGTRNE